MSLPSFPVVNPPIEREDAVNQFSLLLRWKNSA